MHGWRRCRHRLRHKPSKLSGGVLLESSHPVDLGTRGTLRFNFGGVPFSADVKVERLDGQRNGAVERFTIGASFVALSRQDQRVIERFADQ